MGYRFRSLVLFLAFQPLAQAEGPSSAILQFWDFQGVNCIRALAEIPDDRYDRGGWRALNLNMTSWNFYPEKKETLKGVLSKDGRIWIAMQNIPQAQEAMRTFLNLVPDLWLALEFSDDSSPRKTRRHASFGTWRALSSFLIRWRNEKEEWEKDGYILGFSQNISPWVLLRSDEKAPPLVLRAIVLPEGMVYEISGLKIKERAQIFGRLDPRRYLGILGLPLVETELVAVPSDLFLSIIDLEVSTEPKPSTIYDLFPNGEKLKQAAQVAQVLGTSVTALVPKKDRQYKVQARDEKEIVIFAKDHAHAVELVGRLFLALPQEQQTHLLKTKSNWTNFVKRFLSDYYYFDNYDSDITWGQYMRYWPIVEGKGVAISSTTMGSGVANKKFTITLTIKEPGASVESIEQLVNAPHPLR